jgi:hypothetical protein
VPGTVVLTLIVTVTEPKEHPWSRSDAPSVTPSLELSGEPSVGSSRTS